MVQRSGLVAVVLAGLGTVTAADRISEPPPADSHPPVAIALVIEGDVVHLPDPAGINPDDGGRFAALQLALDSIANAAPRGSMGTLIVYYDHAQVTRGLGPLASLRGDALGRIDDYQGKTGRNLVEGLTHALDALEQAPHMAKAVIIAGDGADNQLDTSPAAMRDLRDRARADEIAIYSIAMDAGIGDSMTALRYAAPRERFAARGVLDIVPAFEGTFRDFLAGATDPMPDADAPAPPPAASHRTLAWSLLAAGVALGAFAAAVLLRRRLPPTAGRSS